MKKKILLGSIVAIVIIILASYTSVVGFQKSNDDAVRFSPLFRIRGKRAIDTNNDDILTSEYLGKEKDVDIHLPERNSQYVLVQKVLDGIGRMDNTTFDRFVALVINRFQAKNNIDDIKTTLYEIRHSTNEFEFNFVDGNEFYPHFNYYTTQDIFMCKVLLLIAIAYLIISEFINLIFSLFILC